MAGRPLGATKVVKTRDKTKLAAIAKILGIGKVDPKTLVTAELRTLKPAARKSARKPRGG